jgi:uncharacterized protein (TIGR02687 family)
MSRIQSALSTLFEKYRIVFWYDTKRELRSEYESLWLADVEKIELKNNEYGVKHLLLREKPDQKYLIYHDGPQPDDLNNWLLDVQLAHGLFSADQISLWMNELELSPSLWNLVQEHIEFFKDDSRRFALKARLDKDESHASVRTKMLAVCVNSDAENRVESVLEVLLAELAENNHAKIDLVQQCNLDTFLWNRLEAQFGYKSQVSSIRDFAISLFNACYSQSLEEPSYLTQDALVFLKRWRDSVRFQTAFEKLSEQCSEILGIEKDLQNREARKLVNVDFFRLIDSKIIDDLRQQILGQTISAGDCARLIWQRRNTHWFKEFTDIYEALYYASQFINELSNADLQMDSMADGIHKYQNTWYLLDQYYRKFIYHVRASNQNTLLGKLIERIENLYSNNYLLKVNDHWQHFVDDSQGWLAAPICKQSDFYNLYVVDYIANKLKVAVIVSDALRYEIGQELVGVIEKEEGYTAEIEPMLSTLPSYTQLGMAALLPHQQLAITKDANVLVDGQSSQGLENRTKILSAATQKGAIAFRAEDFLSMNRDRYREETKGAQVVYIYHDQIDHTGDDKVSEGRVFDVVDKTFEEILNLLKKLYDSYFINILITADHGFIYQNQPLDESEFTVEDVQGDEILYRHRRFVLGKGLRKNKSAKYFTSEELGLKAGLEIAIPKSIKRLRQQGSGSRYVHGGAALQEVVIPLIKVNKKRSMDTELVDVDIITSSSSIITSGQISVAFYQTQPVSGKVLARQLQAGIYAQDDTPLSDIHTLNFDLTSENPREREVRVRFVLSRKADDVNNQTIYLKLKEQVPGTSHYKEYSSTPYQLRRSFTTDFDF